MQPEATYKSPEESIGTGTDRVTSPGEILPLVLSLERGLDELLNVKIQIEERMERVIKPATKVIEGRAYLPKIEARSEVGRRLATLDLKLTAATIHMRDLLKRIEL